ncbi:MAG: hybrid sensor histidine kinase/response regulator [Candidatus Kapaibacterium sp.]|nr:MAG: hybrid sensor histidine kinase/response regulator [Candidatus Kapabacteria bacterium]
MDSAFTATSSLITPSETVILIADDLQDNLNIVKAVLGYKGYQVDTAKNGKQVLEQLEKRVPDLILLDIQMPEMNGIEACRILKADARFAAIPVIFLTAKADSYDIVDGFKTGAVDYITKPFNTMELLARVQTHLDLKKSRDLLSEKNRYLEVMSTGLSRLNHEKNDFMDIAAHDLKNPLTTIKGLADFLRQNNDIPPESVKAILENIIKSSERMFAIVRNLLDVNAIESGNFHFTPSQVDMEEIVRDLMQQYEYQASQKKIRFAFTLEGGSALVSANTDSMTQILDNVLSNALKYSPHDAEVRITLTKQNGTVRCAIQDEGQGLSDADKEKLFGKFAQLSAQPTGGEQSTGLGLFIVKKLVEAMNGKVWCESVHGKGATFFLEFPAV